MTTKKMVLLSALTALSIVLNWLENLFFPWTVLAAPGFKLGLANVVFLVILLTSGFFYALTLSLIRVAVVGLFSGTFATVVFPLSLGGAVLSLVVIKAARMVGGEKFSVIGLSVLGAIGHNLGQVAGLMLIPGLFPRGAIIYWLLPVLIILAIPAGLVTGWVAQQILPVILREWENR